MRYKQLFHIMLLLYAFSGTYAQPNFTVSDSVGCTPFAVKFSIDTSSVDMDTIDYLTWDFGLADTINSLDPDTIVYLNSGTYTVQIIINGDRDNPVVKTDYITVYQTLPASFRYEEVSSATPMSLTYNFIPLAEITDTAVMYFFIWRYDLINPDSSLTSIRFQENVVDYATRDNASDVIVFPDTATYMVRLRVEDDRGCENETRQVIVIREGVNLPNIFLPKSSPFYIIDPSDLNIVLSIKIYSRSGILVYQQEAPVITWDGRTSSGLDLNTGVYYFILESIQGDPLGNYDQTGFIHLFR